MSEKSRTRLVFENHSAKGDKTVITALIQSGETLEREQEAALATIKRLRIELIQNPARTELDRLRATLADRYNHAAVNNKPEVAAALREIMETTR